MPMGDITRNGHPRKSAAMTLSRNSDASLPVIQTRFVRSTAQRLNDLRRSLIVLLIASFHLDRVTLSYAVRERDVASRHIRHLNFGWLNFRHLDVPHQHIRMHIQSDLVGFRDPRFNRLSFHGFSAYATMIVDQGILDIF